MAEEIEHARLFHEPRDEIESGLAILHAELAWRIIRPGDCDLVVGEAEGLEHLLDDLWHAQLLEDAAVAGVRHEPHPRHNLRRVPPIGTQGQRTSVEAADHAIDRPAVSVMVADNSVDPAAYQALRPDRVVRRQHLHLVAEQLREWFIADQRRQQQVILAERRLDRHEVLILREVDSVHQSGFPLLALSFEARPGADRGRRRHWQRKDIHPARKANSCIRIGRQN